jgi:sortase (surface protein transpeptidase)
MGRWPGDSPDTQARTRVAGIRVVMSWPDSEYAPKPPPRGRSRLRLAGFAGVLLSAAGILAVGIALLSQQHAPAPAVSAAGSTGIKPASGTKTAKGPVLRKSPPVAVSIPAIGVKSKLLHLGLNADGTLQVPSLTTSAGEAAWYKYSVTPGQTGASVIEGHVDSYAGPAVFYRLGALRPGNQVNVALADGVTAVFRVTGVREYAKDKFPAQTIYAKTDYAALRLITCGGDFDSATGHYLSSIVVYATLVKPAHRQPAPAG